MLRRELVDRIATLPCEYVDPGVESKLSVSDGGEDSCQ
jgi:hypothetical protein